MTEVFTRHRFDTRRRLLTVQSAERLTPHMIRIVVSGPDLADFVSLGADDHIKLFFGNGAGKPQMRDYTPRYYDTAARTLTLDFAVHEAGPATAWALEAKPGDTLEIGGPRGSSVLAPMFDWYLLIGDETALPAMGRRVEELGADVSVITLGIVPDHLDEQVWTTAATHTAHWLHRPLEDAANPAPVIEALRGIELPAGNGFVWIGAEAAVARAARDHIHDRGHPREWTKASGYWVKGQANGKDKLND